MLLEALARRAGVGPVSTGLTMIPAGVRARPASLATAPFLTLAQLSRRHRLVFVVVNKDRQTWRRRRRRGGRRRWRRRLSGRRPRCAGRRRPRHFIHGLLAVQPPHAVAQRLHVQLVTVIYPGVEVKLPAGAAARTRRVHPWRHLVPGRSRSRLARFHLSRIVTRGVEYPVPAEGAPHHFQTRRFGQWLRIGRPCGCGRRDGRGSRWRDRRRRGRWQTASPSAAAAQGSMAGRLSR